MMNNLEKKVETISFDLVGDQVVIRSSIRCETRQVVADYENAYGPTPNVSFFPCSLFQKAKKGTDRKWKVTYGPGYFS